MNTASTRVFPESRIGTREFRVGWEDIKFYCDICSNGG